MMCALDHSGDSETPGLHVLPAYDGRRDVGDAHEQPETPGLHMRMHYTREQVEFILRRIPIFYTHFPLRDDERGLRVLRSRMERNTLEPRMVQRADVEWALNQLPLKYYSCVYHYYVGNDGSRTMIGVADALGIDWETLKRRCNRGLNQMVDTLNGR